MNLDSIKAFCLAKQGAEEDFPFDLTTMTFKVGGKIFALTDINELPLRLSLKCEPMYAVMLRQDYPSIIPGYHLNKQHWNTLILDNTIPEKLLCEMIDLSYSLVFGSLTKIKQKAIREER
jgi:predicted DNA-binding protein (MmcQ/YjbR family)